MISGCLRPTELLPFSRSIHFPQRFLRVVVEQRFCFLLSHFLLLGHRRHTVIQIKVIIEDQEDDIAIIKTSTEDQLKIVDMVRRYGFDLAVKIIVGIPEIGV